MIESGFFPREQSKEFITISASATLKRIQALGNLFAEFLFTKLHLFVAVRKQTQRIPDGLTGSIDFSRIERKL